MSSISKQTFAAAVVLCLVPIGAFAAAPAADSAGTPGYPAAWATGGNPGLGFAPWLIVPVPGAGVAGTFYGSSTTNADGADDGAVGGVAADGDINSPGAGAWGLFAGGGGLVDAYRPFTGPMVAGETIRLDMDNGLIPPAPPGSPPGAPLSVGFSLNGGAGPGAFFTFGFVGGDPTYSYVDAGGVKVPTTIGYTDEGLSISVVVAPGPGASLLTITTKGGASAAIPITLAGAPGAVDLFDNNGAGGAGGPPFYVFFNNLAITPPNSAPTNILLSITNVAENLATGTKVGAFSTQDPDAGNTFTYALTNGTGDTDNGSFTISGSNLLTSASFNYEVMSNYTIRIQSTDQGGLFTQKVFAVFVTDVDETPVLYGLTGPISSNLVLRWSSVTNHLYTVQYSTNLVAGFSVLESNIPATPAINSYTDAVLNVPQKFWRISTDP